MKRKLIILISSVLSPTSANKKLHYSYLFCLLALPSSVVLLSYLATALTGCDIVPLHWHSWPSCVPLLQKGRLPFLLYSVRYSGIFATWTNLVIDGLRHTDIQWYTAKTIRYSGVFPSSPDWSIGLTYSETCRPGDMGHHCFLPRCYNQCRNTTLLCNVCLKNSCWFYSIHCLL